MKIALLRTPLGGIQKLRGQEEGEGGSLECPRGPKPSYFRKHFVQLYTRMVGKKEKK